MDGGACLGDGAGLPHGLGGREAHLSSGGMRTGPGSAACLLTHTTARQARHTREAHLVGGDICTWLSSAVGTLAHTLSLPCKPV